jgi:hypothetical protein
VTAIQVKQVPDEIHDAVRRRASAQGMTIGEYVLSLHREDLALPMQSEWFARVAGRTPVRRVDTAAAVRAARRERDAEQVAAHRR